MIDVSVWSLLGLSDAARDRYETLLRGKNRPSRVGFEHAAEEELRRVGLIRLRGGSYITRRPSSALQDLAAQRRHTLDEVTGVARRLDYLFESGKREFDTEEGPIRLISGAREIVGMLERLIDSAAGTIDLIDTPPYIADPNAHLHDSETSAASKGIHIRTLVHSSAMKSPAHLQDLHRSLDEGQRIAVSRRDSLQKFVIIDHTYALLPLPHGDPADEPRAAVIDHADLTAVYLSLFELYWEEATPLVPHTPSPEAILAPTDDGLNHLEQKLVALLRNGFSDGAIAAALGVSERTLRRRIADLSARHGATSRFQLGYLLRATAESVNPHERSDSK